MPYPGGCSNTTKIDTIDTVVDGIETHVHSIETKTDTIDGIVDTLTVNLANLAPLYGSVTVVPHLADGTTVTSGNAAWTVGDATGTIFTAAGNTIVEIHVYACTASKDFHLTLYAGGAECGECSFESTSVGSFHIKFQTQKLTGAITAKLATASGAGTETCKIKLWYV